MANDYGCVFRKISDERVDIVWEITAKCNLTCEYCFRTSPSGPQLSLAQIQLIIDQMNSDSFGRVLITGGEPLLMSGISEVLRALSDKGLAVKIVSNLSFVPRRLSEIFNIPGIQISTSIDGHTESIHDSIRGSGSLAKMKINIGQLKDAGIDVSGICVVTKENAIHVDEIVALANDLRLDTLTFSKLIDISYPGSLDVSSVVEQGTINAKEEGAFFEEISKAREKYYGISIRTVGFLESAVSCQKAGRNLIYINPNGIVQPCTLYRLSSLDTDLKIRSLDTILETLRSVPRSEGVSFCGSLRVELPNNIIQRG